MPIQSVRTRDREWFQRNRALVVGELVAAVLIVAGNLLGILPVSSTPFLLIFGWLSLWLRGLGWRDVGFARPAGWWRAVWLGVITGVAYQYISLYAVEPLVAHFTGELPDASLFASLIGNVQFLAFILLVTWTLAAFGEELVFRGYLMNRIADAGGNGRVAWALSLLVVSVLFGAAHLYQGASGIIDSAMSGLVLGGLYFASGRNLVAPIVAHGTYDTVAAVLMFLHKYPGM